MANNISKGDNVIQTNNRTIPDSSEKSLSASEYSHMLNSTDEGVVLILDAKIKFVNSAINRLLGYSVEETKGMGFSSLIGPEHLELVIERYMARLQGEDVPSVYDITLKRKNGTIVPVEIHSSMFDYDGQSATLVMVRDITDRLERENTLKENELNFKSLYNSMNEGVCQHEIIYDDSGKAVDYQVIDANQKYEEILNLKKEDVIGKLASETYDTDKPPYLDIYAEVTETGQSTKFETYFPPMDKHFSISVFSPKKGKFATVFNDITQLKKDEASIKESEEKYRLISENVNDVIWTIDFDGNMTYVSPSVEKLRGYTSEEVMKQSLEENLMPEGVELFETEVAKLLQSIGNDEVIDEQSTFTIEQPCKDGSTVWVEVSVGLIYDSNGEPIGIQGLSRNISERKKLNEILKAKVEELERYKKATIDRELKMVELKKELDEQKAGDA